MESLGFRVWGSGFGVGGLGLQACDAELGSIAFLRDQVLDTILPSGFKF